MRVEGSFLTMGGAYEFSVPDDFDPQPELVGVVGRTKHERYIMHRPAHRVDPYDGALHRFDVRSAGQTVSVFQALDVPQARMAYWEVPGGYVFTFVDQRNGPDPDHEIRLVIDAIRLTTSVAGLPRVTVAGPVIGMGNGRDPRHRNRIEFLPREGTEQRRFLTIWNEPPWVSRGASRRDESGWAARSITNELHLTVEMVGPDAQADAMERAASKVAASAIPLDLRDPVAVPSVAAGR